MRPIRAAFLLWLRCRHKNRGKQREEKQERQERQEREEKQEGKERQECDKRQEREERNEEDAGKPAEGVQGARGVGRAMFYGAGGGRGSESFQAARGLCQIRRGSGISRASFAGTGEVHDL